jgi:hypothetical protein
MTPGEKKTLKFQMMMSPEEARILDEWMFANRIRSRAEAIRRLCKIGLAGSDIRSAEIEAENRAYERAASLTDPLPVAAKIRALKHPEQG